MNKILHTIMFAALLVVGTALAADGKVTISSPADGATVSSASGFKLTYDAVLGPDGNHMHLNVDGKRVDVVRETKGTVDVDALPPGVHEICLAVNTSSHVPTGVQGCINVTSK
jgi:hypothetical protein